MGIVNIFWNTNIGYPLNFRRNFLGRATNLCEAFVASHACTLGTLSSKFSCSKVYVLCIKVNHKTREHRNCGTVEITSVSTSVRRKEV